MLSSHFLTISVNIYDFYLFSALDTNNSQVKRQVFELLSALCVYSADGYNRALEALEHHKNLTRQRYRFKLIVDELHTAASTEYKTAILAFVNCLIISTPQLKVKFFKINNRCVLRSQNI